MDAKKSWKFILMIVVVMTSSLAFADDGSNNQSSKGKAVLDQISGSSNIKRTPSMKFLELQYSSGMLSLFSNYYEGEFSILLVNNKNLESHTFPSMSVGESVCIVLDLGEYDVKAVSNEGLEFYGILEISL